ncbi:MAG: asparagine synthetase B family protein [Pyrinomonadaceae bacterium]
MCGICGVVDWKGGTDTAEMVRRMVPTMRHRGPDDEGVSDFEFRNADLERRSGKSEELRASSEEVGAKREEQKDLAGAVSIGMTRLSIIDIEGGHQPVFNEDGQVGAVLNGEIYNFQELRRQLEDRGHTIRTRSDSEVVVHAYEEWGEECVERFEGMFALAIWDCRSSELSAREGERKLRSSEFRVPSSELSAREEQSGKSKGERLAALTHHSSLITHHSGTLFLARDRLGIKPLYYYARSAESRVPSSEFRVELETRNSKLETNIPELETFLFASEVRTLLASGVVPRRLSKAAVESYLLFGSVSEPMTLVEGVFSLPPGHRMTINLTDTNAPLRPEAYWSIAEARRGESLEFRVSSFEFKSSGDALRGRSGDGESRGSGAQETGRGTESRRNSGGSTNAAQANAAQQTRELLTDSVRKHLIADVPVGVFLSSGIDSTALAALASREAAGVHTFTVAFPEKEFSEAEIARRTAATLGTTHQELMLSGDEMLARLSDAVGALDQPSMDGINTYFVSWGATQAGLKVTLSGLGGDEVFGGYQTFARTAHFQRLATLGNNMPRSLRTAVASAVTGAGGHFVSQDAARKLTAIFSSGESLPDAFYFGRTVFTPAQVAALFGAHKANGATPPWRTWLAETALQARELDAFAAVTCMEARSYLVNTLLRDTDSMSMAHSLEVRVPFLDHPLVEFVTHLPQAAKLRKGIPKALLVEALSDLLPLEVVGQKKRGFTFPWAEWLRGPLKTRVENGLSELSPALREVLDAKETRRIWDDYLEGKTSWSRPWTLYVLNEWVKKNIG